jgi:hypothetical protein
MLTSPRFFFFPVSFHAQGSLTKIEDLIKAYGTPVVSKVQEKYPAYMTTVDAKARSDPTRNPDLEETNAPTKHLAIFSRKRASSIGCSTFFRFFAAPLTVCSSSPQKNRSTPP